MTNVNLLFLDLFSNYSMQDVKVIAKYKEIDYKNLSFNEICLKIAQSIMADKEKQNYCSFRCRSHVCSCCLWS